MKLTVLPKTFKYTPKANPKQKHVETTQEHEKGALLHNNSPRGRAYSQWRANTALYHTIVCCGEWMASKHCSLSRCSSSWRADYSPWRIMTDLCREVRFFTPKTQFSLTPIPNLIGNSTCDDSTTCTSIIHRFYGLSTLLTTNFLPHDLIPKSTNNNNNNLSNSVSELHNLRLENVSPTLTLD